MIPSRTPLPKRSPLSRRINQKVCKRGIRKQADDRRHGRDDQRSVFIKSDRESPHRGRQRPKTGRCPASHHPGASFVGGDIHDRLHAYALLNDEQPNNTPDHALPDDQPNAQFIVRSKISYGEDPYDPPYEALQPSHSSSNTQSDTELGENEKLAWMVMPDGFPGVAPPTLR